MELVAFGVGGARCALPVADVREIFRAVAVAPLPGAPAIVEGVVNVRGEVLPVIDLRGRLGAPPAPISASEHMIAASAGERRTVLIRADGDTGLVTVPDDAVQPASEVIAATGTVAGLASLPDGVLFIHDLGGFLTATESEALERALGVTT